MASPPITRQYLLVPSYDTSVQNTKGDLHQAWYRFWDGLVSGTPPDRINTVPITASPFAFRMPYMGYIVPEGGTISSVTLTRDPNQPPIKLPLTGIYHASKDDVLTFTYSAAPTLQLVPQ